MNLKTGPQSSSKITSAQRRDIIFITMHERAGSARYLEARHAADPMNIEAE